jgi:hypothetical protein
MPKIILSDKNPRTAKFLPFVHAIFICNIYVMYLCTYVCKNLVARSTALKIGD